MFGTLALLVSMMGAPQHAPPADAAQDAPAVYLMTMGTGQYVWERFGHNAIWIHDPVRGTDLTYNYGLFDLQQENFILRFIQGRMLYWMDGAPVEYYLRQYRRDNRSIWVQELDLPLAARRELQAFLEWNARPENRYYRYDYYRDNCSTRVRDALDRVLGGALRAQTESVKVDPTYRFHTRRLTTNDIGIYTGLLAALGPAVDRPISAWEEMFLPLAMREHVRHITIVGSDGRERPLVKSERTLYTSSAPAPPPSPPDWLIAYLVAGLFFGGAIVVLSVRAIRSGTSRAGFTILAVIWGLGAGLAGILIAGLWLGTDHAAVYRNVNLFYLNPLAILLAILLPAAAYGKRWARRPAWWVALATAAIALAGLILETVSLVEQVNGSIVALAVPVHLAVAAAARTLSRYNENRIPSIAASTISRGAVRQA